MKVICTLLRDQAEFDRRTRDSGIGFEFRLTPPEPNPFIAHALREPPSFQKSIYMSFQPPYNYNNFHNDGRSGEQWK